MWQLRLELLYKKPALPGIEHSGPSAEPWKKRRAGGVLRCFQGSPNTALNRALVNRARIIHADVGSSDKEEPGTGSWRRGGVLLQGGKEVS